MASISSIASDFVGFTSENEAWIVALRIFFTITAILLVMSIIPLTKDLGRAGIKHKYRITFLWLWNFIKALYYAHRTIFIHLVIAKENIFTGLDKEIKAEEDKKRNRV